MKVDTRYISDVFMIKIQNKLHSPDENWQTPHTRDTRTGLPRRQREISWRPWFPKLQTSEKQRTQIQRYSRSFSRQRCSGTAVAATCGSRSTGPGTLTGVIRIPVSRYQIELGLLERPGGSAESVTRSLSCSTLRSLLGATNRGGATPCHHKMRHFAPLSRRGQHTATPRFPGNMWLRVTSAGHLENMRAFSCNIIRRTFARRIKSGPKRSGDVGIRRVAIFHYFYILKKEFLLYSCTRL